MYWQFMYNSHHADQDYKHWRQYKINMKININKQTFNICVLRLAVTY